MRLYTDIPLGALALITLAGPAVIFILYYRRGAL
jgi:hypothetical protein